MQCHKIRGREAKGFTVVQLSKSGESDYLSTLKKDEGPIKDVTVAIPLGKLVQKRKQSGKKEGHRHTRTNMPRKVTRHALIR